MYRECGPGSADRVRENSRTEKRFSEVLLFDYSLEEEKE